VRYFIRNTPSAYAVVVCCIDRLNSPAKAVVRNWLLLAERAHCFSNRQALQPFSPQAPNPHESNPVDWPAETLFVVPAHLARELIALVPSLRSLAGQRLLFEAKQSLSLRFVLLSKLLTHCVLVVVKEDEDRETALNRIVELPFRVANAIRVN